MSAPFPSPTKKWHSNTYDTLSPTRPELSAAGKTILITGGGSGIGAETARYFAAAGASRIALLGRRPQPLHDTKDSIHEKYPHVDVFTAAVDVSVQEEVNKAFAEFLGKDATKRTIDVLVSNAALTGPMESVEAVDPIAFLSAVQKNIKLALYTAQAFLRYASPNAVVINVSSSAAHVNFADKFAAYSVAKLAVYRLWDSLAFGKPDMRVYHIQPGVVDTDMNKEAGGVKAMGFEDHVSLPASFTLWLASPEAAFLRGKFLWANWDVDELKAHAQEIEASTKFNIGLGGWPFDDAGFDSRAQIGNWS